MQFFSTLEKIEHFCDVCQERTLHYRFASQVAPFCAVCSDRLAQADQQQQRELSYQRFKQSLLAETSVELEHVELTRKAGKQEVITYAHQIACNSQNCTTTLNLLLFGSVGTGKTTHALYVALYAYQKLGIKAQYVKSYALVANIQPYLNSTMLIIDELHKAIRLYGEKPSEQDKTELYKLVEHRRNRRLPTIFISNYDKDGLLPSLGEELYDRISDKHKTIGVHFCGESYRQQLS